MQLPKPLLDVVSTQDVELHCRPHRIVAAFAIMNFAWGLILLYLVSVVADRAVSPDAHTGFFDYALGILGFIFAATSITRGFRHLSVLKTTHLLVTTSSIYFIASWHSDSFVKLDRDNVDLIDSNQPLLGKIFGYGFVSIGSAGGRSIPLFPIANHLAVAHALQ